MTLQFPRNIIEDAPLLRAPLPLTWTAPHVALRIMQGFQIQQLSPERDCFSVRSGWPDYKHAPDDLDEQTKQRGLEEAQAVQDQPSGADIARADEVTYWAMKYLGSKFPPLAAAVNAVACARAQGGDAASAARKYGGYADTWRERHDRGCELIAEGLIADRVRVF